MKGLFAELSAKLDALSHLSLTPKPIVTDLEVHADVPAIAMEEAAPVATSMAAMQAPEEAHAKVCIPYGNMVPCASIKSVGNMVTINNRYLHSRRFHIVSRISEIDPGDEAVL